MTFRNKSIDIGDLVETVYSISNELKVHDIGVVIGCPEEWENRKVSVYWNEIGIRLEWLNDIRRLDTENKLTKGEANEI